MLLRSLGPWVLGSFLRLRRSGSASSFGPGSGSGSGSVSGSGVLLLLLLASLLETLAGEYAGSREPDNQTAKRL